ncbi:hypothetical protein VP01_1751g1 [Puccinia sorghi]|uniref:Uncharacterized protein n=1 Tax=Puccinia sorghi TaxID=27349 RepID=A0A0L6VF40_9BASI|nr:hypothetical protein VP01_1751g1 [Puccinia sorghi]
MEEECPHLGASMAEADIEIEDELSRMGRSPGSLGKLYSAAHCPCGSWKSSISSRSKVSSLDRASIKEDHKKHEQLQQHAEIEALTRQKAEIKKAIQLIQTDLDNLTKRLALSGLDDYPLSL